MHTEHTLEWVVLGGAIISFLYHLVLYIQQKDRYLLLYSNYLFSLSLFVAFRRITNYDSFEFSTNRIAFAFDYPLLLYMLVSYVYFISLLVEMHNNARIIKFTVYGFYFSALVFLIDHIYKIFFTTEAYLSREYFLLSKIIMVSLAFVGLSSAWKLRKTVFIRFILGGGFIYAIFSLLTIISVYYKTAILGLYQYDLYFIGCLLDILMFSSALGYRSHLINLEKINTQEALTNQSLKNQELLKEQRMLLEKENQQRQALIELNKNIQQELGSRLSSIHVYTELASKSINIDLQKCQDYLDKASSLSTQLMTDMGDILWVAALPDNFSTEDIKARIHNHAAESLRHQHINYTILFSESFDKALFSKNQLGEIFTTFKNTIEKFQNDGILKTIQFEMNDNSPTVSVK